MERNRTDRRTQTAPRTQKDWTIGRLDEIPLGEGRTYTVGSRRVAIFRLRCGRVLATQAECPHQGGPLADGLTGEGRVVCPLHERVFDLETGAGIGQDDKLETFAVHVTDDGWIRLSAIGIEPEAAPEPEEGG